MTALILFEHRCNEDKVHRIRAVINMVLYICDPSHMSVASSTPTYISSLAFPSSLFSTGMPMTWPLSMASISIRGP